MSGPATRPSIPSAAPGLAGAESRDVLAPDVSEAFMKVMKIDNPLVERTGFVLHSSQFVFRSQMERMLRDAGSGSRRQLFAESTPMETWLGEVLTPEERSRLKGFLAAT